jgi:hypothetical protein
MIHENSVASHKEHENSGKGPSFRQRIINCLSQYAGKARTDREIMNELGVTDANSIRPSITQLKKKGAIEECGTMMCRWTGKRVRLVRIPV